MKQLKVRTKGGALPEGKPRVCFTCHPEDLNHTLDRICEMLFAAHEYTMKGKHE